MSLEYTVLAVAAGMMLVSLTAKPPEETRSLEAVTFPAGATRTAPSANVAARSAARPVETRRERIDR